jgi:hypothetical protein
VLRVGDHCRVQQGNSVKQSSVGQIVVLREWLGNDRWGVELADEFPGSEILSKYSSTCHTMLSSDGCAAIMVNKN